MKRLILSSILYFIIVHLGFSQTCDILSDDFSNSGLWTQVGTDVLVTNNRVEFQNDAANGSQKRVYRSIGTILGSSDIWSVEVDFFVGTIPSGSGTAVDPIVLTAGTQEPFNDCPDIACTGNPPGTQDMIGVSFGTPTSTSQDRRFRIRAREGTTSTEWKSPVISATAKNTAYYIKLERTSPTEVSLAIFSDASRTLHLSGSPVSLTIPNTIEGLSTAQVNSHANGGFSRKFNGWVDNLCLSSSLLVPTLSQWGLIIFVLLLLTLGSLAIKVRQLAITGTQTSDVKLNALPFEPKLYGRFLIISLLLIVSIFVFSILIFDYQLMNFDVPGILIASPILAYLLFLMIGTEKFRL